MEVRMIKLNFDKLGGLVPVIVQDYKSKKVLMLGFMNEEAWKRTLDTGKVNYFSRSRNKLWTKGETSGNYQIVKEILVDCDMDTVLVKVEQEGKAACHEGYESCFFRKLEEDGLKITDERIFDPEDVYGEGERK